MQIRDHLIDLITNCVDAGAKHVLVMLAKLDDGISLSVSDDGTGITAEQIAKAFEGSKGSRGNGLKLIKESAEASGGSFAISGNERGTEAQAIFKGNADVSGIGDSFIVFWQEFGIMDFTLSATSSKGGFCLDSRLIETKYGSLKDMETMVKVRKDINLNITNLFGGK